MITITNAEFLQVLFGKDAPFVHVTDFHYDPNNIPIGAHLSAWKGDYFDRYTFGENTNQYFTISNFYPDSKGIARRRKVLYRHTPVIVLDDVKEKLNLDEVKKLPDPTWVLETSEGSEQWGYILDTPCTDRARVENLLDGLVANGLAPEGKDPGMKGVTRYVRLPEGVNTKASKLVNGQPFKCRINHWQPFNTVTLDQLAKPFLVDLDRPRRENRVDGAAQIDDHPLVNAPDLLHIKEWRSDGRFDVTCPWVDEHTGEDDSGAAIFTNSDGTMGFKCHHGACHNRNGATLLGYLEEESPGFGSQLKQWQIMREFSGINTEPVAPPPSNNLPAPPDAPTTKEITVEDLVSQLRVLPKSQDQRDYATKILKLVDSYGGVERIHWHDTVRDIMGWTKPEMKEIVSGLRKEWYITTDTTSSFFDDVVYVGSLNQFFNRRKQIFYTPEAYQNNYSHLSAEVKKNALEGGLVTKVDSIDYAPMKPAVFEGDDGIRYANSWEDVPEIEGATGDITKYLDHFDKLGWGSNRKHLMQWMAYTILHPDKKINHMIILGSGEGGGKDWLLYPLVKAMGRNHETIAGEELLSEFNEYLLSTKHLHINEAELGDRREALSVSTKLKPLATAPPAKLRVNDKGVKKVKVTNLVSCSMSTNSQMPIRLTGVSRRFYAVWSDLNTRDSDLNVLPEWQDYWEDRWRWMEEEGGADAVIHYLRNNVDLSDFKPGAAPPMTDFLREITDSSKSPIHQTIEEFFNRKIAAFKCDLATTTDIASTLMAGPLSGHEAIMYADSKLFTPTRVGIVLKEIAGFTRKKAGKGNAVMKLWVMRNHEVYANMTFSELHEEYEAQMSGVERIVAPPPPSLTVVQ